MSEPVISIIVPVYNVEKYLHRCIDSIRAQTFKNIEIILVDDGSTDLSGTICERYATKDKRITVIHKTNGGLSDARNYGLDVCRGEYIGFVDSDDIIDPKMYEILLLEIKRNYASMVTCFSNKFVYDDEVMEFHDNEESIVITNREEMIEWLFCRIKKGLTISVCVKLYKREVFNNVRFKKNMTVEDGLIFLDTIRNIPKMVICPKRLYNYRTRDDSITQTRTWNNNVLDVIKVYQHNYELIKKEFPRAINAAEVRRIWSYQDCLKKLGMIKELKKPQLIKKIKVMLLKALIKNSNNEFLTLSTVFKCIVLLIDFRLYKILLIIKKRVR